MDMKAALQDKRRKLEELKRKREDRQKKHALDGPAAGVGSPTGASEFDTDKLLNSLIGPPQSTPQRPSQETKGTPAPAEPTVTTVINVGGKGKIQLGKSKTEEVSIAARTVPTYDKEIQVGDMGMDSKQEEDEEEKQRKQQQENERKRREKEEQEQQEKMRREQEEAEKKAMELTAAQKKAIMGTAEFLDFFTRTTKLVERALNQNEMYDVTIDYSSRGEDEKNAKAKSYLTRPVLFFDKNRTYNRPVTSIDWSPKFQELCLCSYAQQEDPMSLEPDGLVLVWNMHMNQRPEYIFSCQSAVLTAQFHPSNHKLIIGGTASGQVVIWDTREGKSSPINRTSLSHGHTYPLYALAAVPSAALHSIITVSTDGRMCIWNENDLVEPTSQQDLKPEKKEAKEGLKEVTTTCFDLPGRDTNSIILGSDEGYLYKARLYDSDVGIFESIKAHDAPVTGVRFHPIHKNSPRDIADLFLTCSYDWTVKLWSNRTSTALYTFESARDYVYDVAWSPIHPAMFVSGDGTGSLDFWDLNKDTEVPVHKSDILSKHSGENKTIERAVSRLKWSDDGKKLAIGSSEGALLVCEAGPEIKANDDDATIFYEKMRKATSTV